MTGTRNPIDAYAPAEIARLVEGAGIAKAEAPLMQTVVLGLLAGVFIAFGSMYFTLVMTGGALGFGPSRVLGGLAFSLGLVLVVVAGAELFTGNNLIVMAWADRRISSVALLRNWVVVYVTNFAGALLAAVAVIWSGTLQLSDGQVADTAIRIAEAKAALVWHEALLRGVLANALVCLAVWLGFAAHSVAGKVLVLLFPISAFVALGFEHSVANMYLIPVGMLAGAAVSLSDLWGNLAFVTLGNIVGGSGFVALVYWLVYLRTGASAAPDSARGGD